MRKPLSAKPCATWPSGCTVNWKNEYDQMTSDAAVDEAILINAYIFTETGQRTG
ncbi:hypothetical protein HT118_25475 [Escherichia coli]|nr:hypothetical protein [Escherichia coli]MBW6098658.1 hypothetical protein [Escherichia coli]